MVGECWVLVVYVPRRHGRSHPTPKPPLYPPPLIEKGRHFRLLPDGVGVLLVIADYLAVNTVLY